MKSGLLFKAMTTLGLSGLLLLGCNPPPTPVREPLVDQSGDVRVTLPAPVSSPTIANPEAVVGSSGEVVSTEAVEPGEGPVLLADGQPISSQSSGASEEIAVSWRVYSDATYAYEISYPSNYVIIERETRQMQPQPLSQVLFLDRTLADSETADLQPPNFSIHVFDNSSQLPLGEWLQANGLLGGAKKFEMEPYSLAGVEGVRVSSPLLMSPNSFIYVAHGGYIYRLTPTDPYSEQMLDTFRFAE
ncbi:MAG: hypothetical protein Kow0063_00030 [Anaerolineae bacterium]